MIISPGRGFIFVHIPKTGGTALALALEARAMKDDTLIGDTPKARKRRGRLKEAQTSGRLWKHSTLADIDGLLSPDEIGAYFTCTLVRNPWDRLVSYYHWLRDQTFDHPAVRLAQHLTFADFLRHADIRRASRATPARHYMRDVQGAERCSCYIRLEHFAQDAQPFVQHLGFDLTLPRVNASKRSRDYRGYYDAALADIVATDCAEDIARFGYAFE